MRKSGDMGMKLSSIGDNIVHIVMEDKNSLAKAMARFQEYYESPFEDIRGQIFTLGYLKYKGSRENPGINTYCGNNLIEADWSGYNFPSSVLLPFVQGLFDPLTPEEEAIVEMLRYRTDDFYIIGTYGDEDPADTMEHEIRHAMYGISNEYKKEVDKLLDAYRAELDPLRKCLASWGYHKDVIDDECHAYMGADHDYFFENFTDDVDKYSIPEVPKLRDKLNKVAEKYKDNLGIQKHLDKSKGK